MSSDPNVHSFLCDETVCPIPTHCAHLCFVEFSLLIQEIDDSHPHLHSFFVGITLNGILISFHSLQTKCITTELTQTLTQTFLSRTQEKYVLYLHSSIQTIHLVNVVCFSVCFSQFWSQVLFLGCIPARAQHFLTQEADAKTHQTKESYVPFGYLEKVFVTFNQIIQELVAPRLLVECAQTLNTTETWIPASLAQIHMPHDRKKKNNQQISVALTTFTANYEFPLFGSNKIKSIFSDPNSTTGRLLVLHKSVIVHKNHCIVSNWRKCQHCQSVKSSPAKQGGCSVPLQLPVCKLPLLAPVGPNPPQTHPRTQGHCNCFCLAWV